MISEQTGSFITYCYSATFVAFSIPSGAQAANFLKSHSLISPVVTIFSNVNKQFCPRYFDWDLTLPSLPV